MTEILEVNNLTTKINRKSGDILLLDHITFSVQEGEIFGLVGESGSGKSMTCRSILRILQPPVFVDAGSVLFEGSDLLKLPEKEMRKVRGRGISMIFQDPMTSLNPVLTIEQQIVEALDSGVAEKSRRMQAIELLRHVGIPSPEERLKEYPHQFSGGMRQRAMIAMALARKPRLLLADEPTTALDVTIQDQVLDLLVNLQREFRMSMILVSHDLGVITQVCNRVAVMYAGEIVEMANTEELFRLPLHPYTLGLMGSMPDIEKNEEWLKPIAGMPPNMSDLPKGCRFHPRCPWASSECQSGRIPLFQAKPDHFSRCIKINELEKVRDYPENDSSNLGIAR